MQFCLNSFLASTLLPFAAEPCSIHLIYSCFRASRPRETLRNGLESCLSSNGSNSNHIQIYDQNDHCCCRARFTPLFMGPKELFARMNEPVLDEVSAMEGCTIFSFSHYLPRQAALGDSCGVVGSIFFFKKGWNAFCTNVTVYTRLERLNMETSLRYIQGLIVSSFYRFYYIYIYTAKCCSDGSSFSISGELKQRGTIQSFCC